MSTRMLIDARHPEETRVAVVRGTRIEEFDFEAETKKQLKGNIYLARVTRVEPSLQAAFVEYGGNRHGFLAFSEIHPDYYQIPVEDREALLQEEFAASRYDDADSAASDDQEDDSREDTEEAAGADAGETGEGGSAGNEDEHDEDAEEDMRRRRTALRRRYKIQEVIKRRQILLVQVVKEERGGKGAALTTYLSLAGRYSVLMPNTTHGGGISRKISSQTDRRRLKSIMSELQLPKGMGCIIRTAGLKRTKTEIKRDFDYLSRLWDEIREQTLNSVAPALIYEDSSLIKRAIRDIYSRDVDEIWVEGDQGYRAAKDYMRLLMPSHAKKVHLYRDRVPLFHRYQVEAQLENMYRPVVQLRSGGYIVINPTEALVSIDINSGRATKEHNIEETAHKTNLEAADEIARQLRLRDMAGLVVIDFIDMEDKNNVRNVERRLKEALKNDRARIQVGRISNFGLMEMSRQRLRTGVLEASTHVCPHCNGAGFIRTIQSSSLHVLRAVEEEAIKARASHLVLRVPEEVAIYVLNRKRAELTEIEERYGILVEVEPKPDLIVPNYEIERSGPPPAIAPIELAAEPVPAEEPDEEDLLIEDEEDIEDEETSERPASEEREPREAREARDTGDQGENEGGRRRRRRRRRRRSGETNGELQGEGHGESETEAEAQSEAESDAVAGEGAAEEARAEGAGENGEGDRRRRRRRRRRGERGERGDRPGRRDPLEPEVTLSSTGETIVEADAQRLAAALSAAAPAQPEVVEGATLPVIAAGSFNPSQVHDYVAAEIVEAPAVETLAAEEEAAKPKRRARRTSTRTKAKAEPAATEAVTEAPAEAAPAAPAEAAPDAVALEATEEKPKPKRRTRKAAPKAEAEAASEEAAAEAPVKAKGRPRKAAAAKDAAEPEAGEKPKARRTRKAAPKAEAAPVEASTEAPAAPAPAPAAEAVTAPANEGAPAANEAGETAPRPARRGWWQRTFSDN